MPRPRRPLFTWAGVWALAMAWLALAGPVAAQPGGFGAPGGDGSDEPVVWSVELSQYKGRPGDRVIVAITAEVTTAPDSLGKHWHIYPNAEQHGDAHEVPTSFTADFPWDLFHVGDIQWPAATEVVNASGAMQPVYEGTQRFYIPVIIDRDAEPGVLPLNVEVMYMACASSCLPPQEVTLTKAFTILEAEAEPPVSRADGEAFADFDPSVFEGMPTTLDEASGMEGNDPESTESGDESDDEGAGATSFDSDNRISGQLFGLTYDFDGSGPFAILVAVLLAFVGGTILNLMPCVLPIIPIKIMGLTQATGSRAQSIMLGSVMLLGVVTFWLVLGLAVASLSGFDSVNSLFKQPLFGIGVGLFILIMAAGMMGAFAVGLPQWVYRINPKHDSPVGAFGFGVMAAVLSTPCTAPFMGASLAWATRQPSSLITVAVFVAIGLGMGWPYLVLAAFPKLVEKVPRTGPASELVKQVLGLMLIATAIFFLGAGIIGLISQRPYLGPVLHWWMIVAVVGALAFWLSYRTFQITPSMMRRFIFTAAGLFVFAAVTFFSWTLTRGEREAYWSAYQASLDAEDGSPESLGLWAHYTPNRFKHAVDDGKITVVEFTAVW